MVIYSILLFKDIDQNCYSNDGKTLIKVNDTSPNLRISAKCEIKQDRCFINLYSLISFSFQENPNLKTIGEYCFAYCYNLTIINLSSCSKLIKISHCAFYYCRNVTEILLPKGLLEIQYWDFEFIDLVTSVIIPASVKNIGEDAFAFCHKLENVTFEESSNLTSLEKSVFGATNITSFQIPEKVTKISGQAFDNYKFTNITIHPKNKYLIIENNAIFSTNKSNLFYFFNRSFETYEIPDYVATLGDYLFYYTKIKSITLPNSITSIGEYCFYCSQISAIAFSSLTTIGSYCFTYSKLIYVVIPESVKK